MASAAEQLAANMNMGSFAKATEQHKRLLFTLGALLVYPAAEYTRYGFFLFALFVI